MTLLRSRAAAGTVLTLLALGLAVAGVLALAENTGTGSGEFVLELSLTFAVALGWALGGGLESFYRRADGWGELLWFRLFAGSLLVVFAMLGALLGLQALGVGSGRL